MIMIVTLYATCERVMTVLLFSDTSRASRAPGSRRGALPATSATATSTVVVAMEEPSVTVKVMASSSEVRPACSYCSALRVMSLKVNRSPVDRKHKTRLHVTDANQARHVYSYSIACFIHNVKNLVVEPW